MDLKSQLDCLACRVIDIDEARTITHQEVLLILAQTFDSVGVIFLCEPSVVGGYSGPPDIALLDPTSGLHVFEVKGIDIDQARSVVAGGAVEIAYGSKKTRRDPVKQARNAMFDIKDSASRHFNGELNIPFQSWVIFPRIRRSEWDDKFGEAVSGRPDVLFAEDLNSSDLKGKLTRTGISRLASIGLRECPSQQLLSVMAAFGDSEVLRPAPRPGPRPPPGSRGERLSDELADYRVLSEQQQQLTLQSWDDGPRLVRGVAGSGKTIVLATQIARMIERRSRANRGLFDQDKSILAVCFNRTLVPFIRQRIEIAYRQRNGADIPAKALVVKHFNGLLYDLSQEGFFSYHGIKNTPDSETRASRYLAELEALSGMQEERLSNGLYHGIFVDEGQDFDEMEYRLLLKFCERTPRDLPRTFIFYDDAQNLYGRRRPTWLDIGLDMRGRSIVMDKSFRNSRQIIEPAFNVLLGTHAADPQSVKTRGFADVAALKDANLIAVDQSGIRVNFAAREGDPVVLTSCESREQEEALLAKRCEHLLKIDKLLPQDIFILTFRRARAFELAAAIAKRIGSEFVRCALREKDSLAIQADKVTVSTIASAKGYDAPCVLLASLEDYPDDLEGRASFYVGCTRAREWLEVSGSSASPFIHEFKASLSSFNLTESDSGISRGS